MGVWFDGIVNVHFDGDSIDVLGSFFFKTRLYILVPGP
jgi:hypothetical protein